MVLNSTTGIVRGAGSWTVVPAEGTAKIVADADAGGEATMLSVDATDEELTFTPAALASATGMETVTFNVKTVPITSLSAPDGDTQAAFAILSTNGIDHSLAAYVSDGASAVWTNLVYGAGADTLTNVWFSLVVDLATVSNVRYVRYSIVPPSGSLTILADSEGTTWFRSAVASATTVNSVSFSGTGDIRSFGGDSLAEPVATYNGENFATVADAIAAAEEGGTVTLVKAVTEGTLTISKNITLDFNGKAVSLGGIVINDGKTLTVTRANSNSNVIPTITGGGNLVVSGNNTFNWKGMAGTSTLASITQENASGGISISGYGMINVAGDVSVTATLTFTPDSATTTEISSGWTIKLVANSVTAGTLAGAGRIETTDGVIAKTDGFYGSFAGEGDILFNADSTIMAPSYFGSGKLSVANGKTVTLAPYDYSAQVKFGFDASNTANWLFEEDSTETVTSLVYTVGASNKGGRFYSYGTTNVAYTASDANYFGGTKPFVMFADGCNYSAANQKSNPGYYNSLAWLFVYQKNDSIGGKILTEKGTDNDGSLKINSSGDWEFKCNGSSKNDYVMVNGVKSRAFVEGEASAVMAFDRVTASNNRFDALGTTLECAVAEAIGFKAVPSVEEYIAINAALQHKWNLVGKMACQFIPATASVELGSGSTIDLGGYTQTIASLSGSGAVQNGSLIVMDAISVPVGNTLVIPYGSTYSLANDGSFAVTNVEAGTITITHCAADISGVPYETVAEAIAAYESGILTVHESATLDFGMTEVNVTNAVLDAGVVLTFTQSAPWATAYDSDACTIVNTRVASTYVWTPDENETDWATLSNWRIGAATPVALPGVNDTVMFPASEEPEFDGWTVALSADVYATNVVVNTNLTFSGGLIHTGNVRGSGTITLNGNAGFHAYDWEQANLDVSNNLVIAGTGNKFHPNGSKSYMNGGSVNIYGTVVGDGEITTVGMRSRVRFYGDWTKFSGTVNAQDDGVPRHVLRLMAAQASSSNAVWNVWMSNENSGNSAFLGTSSNSYKTDDMYHYYFGALNGRITIYQQYNNTLEIGALNQDCAFTGVMAATYRNHIKKVGSATLTFSGSGLGRLEVAGGVFASGTESAMPNERITFTGNDAFFDPTTNTVDFSAKLVSSTYAPIGLLITNNVTIGEIPDSNTAGLVKKGEGTLVLSAPPLYTGDTYLDGGTLKIPAAARVRVKTHVENKAVRRASETIDDVVYTVYTLGNKPGSMIILF